MQRIRDFRTTYGALFPFIEISKGSANNGIQLGSERSSVANELDQDIFEITDNLKIFKGKHTFTIGTHNEFSQSKNVFFGNNFGSYRFSSLDDFLLDRRPNRFQMNYSLIGGSGDESLGAAEFGTKQFGFYIQNDMRLSDNFKLSYGVRVDVPVWEDGLGNADFNNRTIPLLQAAGKNLQGAVVGERINTTAHFAPRLGFNYDLNGKKATQIRGGVGVFTSRLPLVWPGGTYNNNGVTQGAISIENTTSQPRPAPFFNPNPSVDSQIMNGTVALGPLPGSGGRG